jgi:hypothetical protein
VILIALLNACFRRLLAMSIILQIAFFVLRPILSVKTPFVKAGHALYALLCRCFCLQKTQSHLYPTISDTL